MARQRDINALSPAYRARLEKKAAKEGVSLEQLRSQPELMKKARGHEKTPEHGPSVKSSPYLRGQKTAQQHGVVSSKIKDISQMPTPEAAEKMKPPTPRSILRALKKTSTPHVRVAVLIRTQKSPSREEKEGAGKDLEWTSALVRRDSIQAALERIAPNWSLLSAEDQHALMLEQVVYPFFDLQYDADRVLGFSFADSPEKEGE